MTAPERFADSQIPLAPRAPSNMTHAIISLGTDFVVQTWNAGAQRMFGYGEAEARGRSSPN